MAAKEQILLTSGGGYIRIKDGNIEIHCPDLASFKAANHPWTGPTKMEVPLPAFPGEDSSWVKFAGNYSDTWNTVWPLHEVKVDLDKDPVARAMKINHSDKT